MYRPLRLQEHEIAEARRLLGALRELANPLPSFLYDRYLAEAIDDLEHEVHEYEMLRKRAAAGDPLVVGPR